MMVLDWKDFSPKPFLNFLRKYQMERHKINISTKFSILLNQVPNCSDYDTLDTILSIYSLFYLIFSTSSCGLNMVTYSWSYSSPMWPWYIYSSHRMNLLCVLQGTKSLNECMNHHHVEVEQPLSWPVFLTLCKESSRHVASASDTAYFQSIGNYIITPTPILAVTTFFKLNYSIIMPQIE